MSSISNKPQKRNAPITHERRARLTALPVELAPYDPFEASGLNDLYRLGLNVFPIKFRSKEAFGPWHALQRDRLGPDELAHLAELFSQRLSNGAWHRFNKAIMTGRTSENLFIIDCETYAEYSHQGAMLRAARIPIWSVRSSDGGHYYLRSADGEVQNIKPDQARGVGLGDLEIRGNRCYVLAPNSVHPSGVIYQWDERDGDAPPLVHLADLHWLPLETVRQHQRQRTGRNYGQAALEDELRKLADKLPGCHDRNNQLNRSAFALGQLVAGDELDYTAVYTALERVARDIGLDANETRDTLRSGLDAGARQPRRASNTFGTERQQAMQWIAAQQWHGRTGTTRRAVAVALAERANTARNGIFRASVREVAELARCSAKTATARLHELQAAGFVQWAGSDHASGANLWKLGQEVRVITTLTNLGSNSVVNTRTFDACERGALGQTGMLVLRALQKQQKPITPGKLGKAIGLTRHQVRHALNVLQTRGPHGYPLVEHTPDGWIANEVNDDHLQRVALDAGTLGKGEARKAQHRRERQRAAGVQLANAIAKDRAEIERAITGSER